MFRKYFFFILFSISFFTYGQEKDELVISQIFDNVLQNTEAYENLEWLCRETPGRLLGTENSFKAIDYMQAYFKKIGADTIFFQEFKTPAWIHHQTIVTMKLDGKELELRADALGPSNSTPEKGIQAEVIEVNGLEELSQLNPKQIHGKIVFFNRPFDIKKINPFRGYGATVDQRAQGPALAAKLGATAVLVRSVGSKVDSFPHTGSTRYNGEKIPAVAISALDADLLSKTLIEKPKTQVNIFVHASFKEEIVSYNLIADIKGHELPEEYIIVSGHIDAWFNSPGAHDDGIGCVQSADVLRIFKDLKIQNKRSIRAIMYMDEELFQSGGQAYAAYSKTHNVKNFFAMEADAGGFTPIGFNIDAAEEISQQIKSFQPLLLPYGIYYIEDGGSGVDIAPLKNLGVPLMGYRTDPQRYMDLHHSAYDSFDKVHIRELQMGSGNMAAIVYLIDKYLHY